MAMLLQVLLENPGDAAIFLVVDAGIQTDLAVDLASKGATYLRNLKIYKNRVTGHIYERCSGVL